MNIYDFKTHRYDPQDVLDTLKFVKSFFSGASKGQWISCFVLKHVPGASDRLVKKFVQFAIELHEKVESMPDGNGRSPKFREMQDKHILITGIDHKLSELFWGEYNENRDLLTGEQWEIMQSVALSVVQDLVELKGDF